MLLQPPSFENSVHTWLCEAVGALTQIGMIYAKYAMMCTAKTAFCQYGSAFEPAPIVSHWHQDTQDAASLP